MGISQVTIEVRPDLEPWRRVLGSALGELHQVPPGTNLELVGPVAQVRSMANLLRQQVGRQVNGPVSERNARPSLHAHQDMGRDIHRLSNGVETSHAKPVGDVAVQQSHGVTSHVF